MRCAGQWNRRIPILTELQMTNNTYIQNKEEDISYKMKLRALTDETFDMPQDIDLKLKPFRLKTCSCVRKEPR